MVAAAEPAAVAQVEAERAAEARGEAAAPRTRRRAAWLYLSQSDEGTTDVYIIDVIGGPCGGSPSPAWVDNTDITIRSGTIGRWTARGRF